MKVFHYINFVFILLLIIAICVVEEVIVSNSLSEMHNRVLAIEKVVEEKDDLLNMDVVMEIENLEYVWTRDEEKLCYLVNHKNIQEIGQEIVKLKLYIADNDIPAFKVSLELIKFYCHSYLHFMGANVHNVL